MATMPEILDFLNEERVRATYGAVGGVLGQPARDVWRALQGQGRRASWVVNGTTGDPTGYTTNQQHPDLYRTQRIIRTGADLRVELMLAETEDDVNNIPRACRNMTPHAAAETLNEVRESRRGQETVLYWWLRIGAAALVLYVAAMAAFTSASGRLAPLAAVMMFLGGLLLLLTLANAGVPSLQWNRKPNIDQPFLRELSQHSTPKETDLHLIDLHMTAHAQNVAKLRSVQLGMGIHIALAVAGGVVALFALLEIAPALIDLRDSTTSVECEDPLGQGGEEPALVLPSEAVPSEAAQCN